MLLKRLDTYIIKKFLGTYVFSIALILSIAVVFDINEKLDKFMSYNAPIGAIVFDYYLNFVPYFANLFSALFVFISVIFFTSNLAGNSEFIAILASGTSFKRIMRPYMISAGIIAIFNFALSAFIIPPSNQAMQNFLQTYVKKRPQQEALLDIQFEVEKDVIVYISRFENAEKTGYRFSLEKFDGKQLKSRLTASTIKYDSGNVWTVRNYMIRNFDGMHENIIRGEVNAAMDTTIQMDLSDMKSSEGLSTEMTSPQLKHYIEKQRKRGIGNLSEFEIEYHRRFARSLAAFILTAIGLSLASQKRKGGMGLHLGIGLGLSFSYILFDTVSSTFAVNGGMNVMLAVWLPNLVYTLIAIALYRNAPK
ncbi:MAG: LptF/LptG family permease [Bacteroidales bacterium]|jgi:lipopolysaccharide export system permease protein|nr:LptF/LptG family permease [Bacteroidales bacterium]